MNISHIVSAAVFASMLGAPGMVFAQQNDLPTAVETATPPADDAPAGYLELGDMNVVNPAGEKIGEVEEVLMDTSGEVVAVAVEVGGFLGIGDDDVIIQLDQLRLENNQLVTALTKEQIEALPKWDD
jgi:PRC-barrel domain